MDAASAQLLRIAKSLRKAADGGALRPVGDVLRRDAEPLAAHVRDAAAAQLPHRGGLAAIVAAQPVNISMHMGANAVSVILTNHNHDAATLNAGYVRHPTFSHSPEDTQATPRARGWWTDTLWRRSNEITPDIQRAMARVAAEIEQGSL